MIFKIVGLITFSIISISMIVYIFIDNRKKGADAPFDDSGMVFDTDAIHKKIRSFIGNSDEQIISILGIKYVEELLKQSVPSKGFCFLTDKAFYMIGDVYQKIGLIQWKSRIQQRVTASDMKAVKVGKLYSLKLFAFTVYVFFRFISLIQIVIGLLTENYDKYAWLIDFFEREIDFIRIYVSLDILLGPLILFFALVYGIANFFLTTRTLISVEFTSQTFGFPVDTLGAKEVKAFYEDVSKVQGLVKEMPQSDDSNNISNNPQILSSLQERVKTLSENAGKVQEFVKNELHTGNNKGSNNHQTVSSVQEKSKVDSLMELSKLYEQKMISQEEFERLKKEILENK